MKYYTNVHLYKGSILVRGYENGERYKEEIQCEPYLFVPSKTGVSDYRTLDGKKVDRIDFNSPYEARNFMERYKDVNGMEIYGLPMFAYPFMNDHFAGEIEYDPKEISVVSLDIETDSGNGFPDIATADQQITAITVRKNGQSVVLGYFDYQPDDESVTYLKCKDESDLLYKFIQIMRSKQFIPDVITGWNVEMFDIPYLINRTTRILGAAAAKRISPWEILDTREITVMNRKQIIHTIVGVTVLDYLSLYRKFSYTPQESYKLDHIAEYELGERKLDYSMYESLDDLYKKDFKRFIDYNIHDARLVDKLEDKLKFIEQVFSLAYDAKVNYIDTLTTVRMWDIIIHNYLMDKKIVVPQWENVSKNRQIEGAYVKDPQVGHHKWVVSFDLNSLYPHLIMQYNISPETYVSTIHGITMENLLNKQLEDPSIRKQLEAQNVCIAATGCLYDKDRRGFLPQLMERMYDDRSLWKKRMIEAKKRNEENPCYDNEKEIARCNNMQMAKKIQLNSVYGALGNEYFRWYDQKYAESITKSGQLSIRWMEKHMNEYLNKTLKTDDVDYVLAIDTDSMYITLDRLVYKVYGDKAADMTNEQIVEFLDKTCSKVLEPYIDKCYSELAEYVNAYEQKMKMKREAIANKGIWTGKKHYILNVFDLEGVRYKEPKLKMQGIEAVRSSTPSACRKKIKEALEVIMSGTQDNLIAFIEQFRSEFFTLPFEEIAFPRSVRGIRDYTSADGSYSKGCPIHVRASILYNQLVKKMKMESKLARIGDGEKIKFAYMKVPNPLMENVFATPGSLPKQFDLDKYIDYDKQFEKSFLEPIRTIVEAVGWETEKRCTLEEFFV